MIYEEFCKKIPELDVEPYIVTLKYKYPWNKKYIIENQYLDVDINAPGYHAWLNDWYEGYSIGDIEVLGWIPLSKVKVEGGKE